MKVGADYRAEREISTEDEIKIYSALEAIQVKNEFISPIDVKEKAAAVIFDFVEKMKGVVLNIEEQDNQKRKDIENAHESVWKFFETNKTALKLIEEFEPVAEQCKNAGLIKFDLKHHMLGHPKRKEAIEKKIGPFFLLLDYFGMR